MRDYLFGRGFGSDLVSTSEWDWTVKNSHNDFLTYLVENGIPFTIVFLALMISLLTLSRKVSVFSVCLIGGYLATSLISNGLAVRPLAGYLFFIIFTI
jgi:O-antigen ligase